MLFHGISQRGAVPVFDGGDYFIVLLVEVVEELFGRDPDQPRVPEVVPCLLYTSPSPRDS